MIARLPVEHGFAFTRAGKLLFHQTSGSNLMAYLLIDPPVSPLSPRLKIQEWLEELARWAKDPEYSDPNVRQQIQRAIADARGWLAAANDVSPPSARDLTL